MIGKKDKISFKDIWNAIKFLSEEEQKKLKDRLENEFADKTSEEANEPMQPEVEDDFQNNEAVLKPQGETKAAPADEKNCDISALMEIITKTEARVAALEQSLQYVIDEELGVDSDFADEVNTQMPASYARQAKEIRF